MLELLNLHSHRVFLRRDALAFGYDDADIAQMLRAHQIARVRWGAYTDFKTWEGSDPVQQHVLRCHAVLMTHGDDVVLSHTSAAAVHGLALWQPTLSHVHLTRLDGTPSRVCRDVRYHRAAMPAHAYSVSPTRTLITTAERSAVEHASISTVESGVVALDSFLHLFRRTDLAELEAVHRTRPSWPGNRRLNITFRLARPGAQSVGESRMRFLMWEYHLPEPELQYVVADRHDKVVGISDFGWESRRLLGEFDGKIKYNALVREGDDSSEVVFREKRREDLMRELTGFSMIRFIWSDLYERDRTASRLRYALGLR